LQYECLHAARARAGGEGYGAFVRSDGGTMPSRCLLRTGIYDGNVEWLAVFLKRKTGVMDTTIKVAQVLTMAAVAAFIAPPNTAAQNYPSKPIRFISPNAPGGSTSTVARLIGQKLTESWGQQVVVDNRPGGNGFIGGDALARATPDGHTLMLISPTHIITPLLILAPYDAIRDFTPVASVSSTEFVLVLNPSVPANTLQELIALAKAKPGQLNYASSGSGSPTNLVAEMFNMMTGVRMQHIPYKGGGPALIELIGGQVQLAFQIPVSAIPHIRGARLHALAVSGETRLPALPQVPTFSEGGLAGFNVTSWYGILAPAGVRKPVVDKLSAEVARYLAQPEFREKLLGQGMEALVSTPQEFAAMMKTDTAKYARVIKAANIKAD
jgi:tripartite-type tricarboxylate transporter receptor subunit TctC